jgi:hypothetical protein
MSRRPCVTVPSSPQICARLPCRRLQAQCSWIEPRTNRGGQPWYSPLAILTALTLRTVFRLALRQTEGLIGSVIRLLGPDLPVPDHTTLSRGGANGMHLIVGSSGLKFRSSATDCVRRPIPVKIPRSRSPSMSSIVCSRLDALSPSAFRNIKPAWKSHAPHLPPCNTLPGAANLTAPARAHYRNNALETVKSRPLSTIQTASPHRRNKPTSPGWPPGKSSTLADSPNPCG